MHLCRECDLLLLRTRAACPQCRALRPGLRLVTVGPERGRASALPWTVAASATAVPLLLAVDQAARWLLGGGA